MSLGRQSSIWTVSSRIPLPWPVQSPFTDRTIPKEDTEKRTEDQQSEAPQEQMDRDLESLCLPGSQAGSGPD